MFKIYPNELQSCNNIFYIFLCWICFVICISFRYAYFNFRRLQKKVLWRNMITGTKEKRPSVLLWNNWRNRLYWESLVSWIRPSHRCLTTSSTTKSNSKDITAKPKTTSSSSLLSWDSWRWFWNIPFWNKCFALILFQLITYDQDFWKIKEAIPLLIEGLHLIWVLSGYYNTDEVMVPFMERIVWCLLEKARKALNNETLFRYVPLLFLC